MSSPPASGAPPRPRLHVLGVPHTVAHPDYSICAFTTKVLTFPDLIQPFGWDVVEYGNAGSASAAREHVVVLEAEELRALSRRTRREDPHELDSTNAELQARHQARLVEEVTARARPGEIVCHVFGPNMELYERLPACRHLELSVGYTASPGLPFRVYETSAWMHWHHGRAGREDGSHYQWVIPPGFDPAEWPLSAEPGGPAVFLGRLTLRKGMNELVEIARRTPEVPIRAYGPGDASAWSAEAPPNLTFHGPVFGAERARVLGGARCVLMPTVFIEPFGNSGVEAQLCGTPLIGSSYGAFTETIEDGVTGWRCHTLADWAEAVRRSPALHRRRIRDIAVAKYDRRLAGERYDRALRQLSDLDGAGWYAERSHRFADAAVVEGAAPRPAPPPRRVWLFIPYFGAPPNFFQLYLDSLGRNADRLTVVMPTDMDLASYTLPANFRATPMSFADLRDRAARLMRRTFDRPVDASAFLASPYKLCDLKIAYPELFADLAADLGATSEDFVGWGDCDLIYGRLDDFLGAADDAHLIGGLHGHFTAVRNVAGLRGLWRRTPGVFDDLHRPEYRVVDEGSFRQPLFAHLREHGLRSYDLHLDMCDVVPQTFWPLFRADHALRLRNFFETYRPEREIVDIGCAADGRLTVRYADGGERGAAYVHLQKRAMTLDPSVRSGPYRIEEHAFTRDFP